MRVEEKILVNELKKQNMEVLEALFKEYFPVLVKYAEGFIFDRSACEDIVQGLFVYLWENAGKIEFKTSIKAYLFQSVKNKCLNYLRDLNIRDRHKLLYLEAMFNTDDHDSRVDAEITNKISSAIDLLPPRMAEIFRMKYLGQEKIAAIAINLEISENSVKTQLLRGKSRLRKALFDLS